MTAMLMLDPADNVAVAIRAIHEGERCTVGPFSVIAREPIAVGHKLAVQDIPEGGAIVKYGVPIGLAREAVPAGSHVHLHNVSSQYIPTRGQASAGSRADD